MVLEKLSAILAFFICNLEYTYTPFASIAIGPGFERQPRLEESPVITVDDERVSEYQTVTSNRHWLHLKNKFTVMEGL